jgi:hypothetical protein
MHANVQVAQRYQLVNVMISNERRDDVPAKCRSDVEPSWTLVRPLHAYGGTS